MVIEKFPYIFKKFVKSSFALVKRNPISTWAMKKSFKFVVIWRVFGFWLQKFINKMRAHQKIVKWQQKLMHRRKHLNSYSSKTQILLQQLQRLPKTKMTKKYNGQLLKLKVLKSGIYQWFVILLVAWIQPGRNMLH